MAYAVHDDGANSYLYVYHTGVADGGNAQRIKRILLPDGCENPKGCAVSGDLAYVSDGANVNVSSIYVFNHANFSDGDRATQTSRFLYNSTVSRGYDGLVYPICIYEDRIYVSRNTHRWGIYDRNSQDGQPITHIKNQQITAAAEGSVGASASKDSLFVFSIVRVYAGDRNAITSPIASDFVIDLGANTPNDLISGASVVGETYYTVDRQDNTMYPHQRDPADSIRSMLVKSFSLPTGLTEPVGLDIPSARE